MHQHAKNCWKLMKIKLKDKRIKKKKKKKNMLLLLLDTETPQLGYKRCRRKVTSKTKI